jgi:uracil-DNA glycosylase family 4
MTKSKQYAELVSARRACRRCQDLTNPAAFEAGRFDSDHIGPWSLWQGNLNAVLMVVGQDCGDTGYFVRYQGRECPGNPTNKALVELAGMAGVRIGDPCAPEGRDVAFFTNSILCLKGSGGLQGAVREEWFSNCSEFLRRQIEIVRPSVVAGLGQRAYDSMMSAFSMEAGPFRAAVEEAEGRILPNGSRVFAVYHCGARIRNTHRPMQMQRDDWERIRRFI